jgi:hypothetical protein
LLVTVGFIPSSLILFILMMEAIGLRNIGSYKIQAASNPRWHSSESLPQKSQILTNIRYYSQGSCHMPGREVTDPGFLTYSRKY